MLFPTKVTDDFGKLEELVSLKIQADEFGLQDKLGKQNYHEKQKKLFEPPTDTNENTSENLTKTKTETSNKNNKALENLNEKVLELIKDKGMIAQYLASSSGNLFKPENESQFKLIEDHSSIRMKEFSINGGIPVTLYSNMLKFIHSNKSFILGGDLLEAITNFGFNVSHSNPKNRKIIYEFGKEMNFKIKQKRRKSPRERPRIKIIKSPAITASGISTIFLSSDPNEKCDRLKLILGEKQAGKNSNMNNEEIDAIVDKLVEYKCISTKQLKQLLVKYNLLHAEKKLI